MSKKKSLTFDLIISDSAKFIKTLVLKKYIYIRSNAIQLLSCQELKILKGFREKNNVYLLNFQEPSSKFQLRLENFLEKLTKRADFD